jgi:hypothetical protein
MFNNNNNTNSNSNSNSQGDIEIGIYLKTNFSDEDFEEKKEFVEKAFHISLSFLITFPILCCDIYYGLNDKSCIKNHVDRFNINLKQYLLISGFYSLGMFLLWLIGIMIHNKKNKKMLSLIALIMSFPSFVFILILDIIGAIIFWNDMDNSTCSGSVYNYVNTSLIIKFVLHGFVFCCGLGLCFIEND